MAIKAITAPIHSYIHVGTIIKATEAKRVNNRK